ncbi:MAG TPA: tetratricopeptide repeat protein, partial [Thermoanaerobaculia bacterium]
DAHASAFRAYILIHLGRPEEAVDWIRKAMRLNPFHPGWYWNPLARALHAAGRHEEALAAFERIAVPRFFHLAYMAVCHHRLGHGLEAARQVRRTLEAKPDFSSGGWLATVPFRREEDRQRLLEELRAAGLPA